MFLGKELCVKRVNIPEKTGDFLCIIILNLCSIIAQVLVCGANMKCGITLIGVLDLSDKRKDNITQEELR